MKNSIVKKAAGVITNNFGLKLLAIVISCGLWFMVDSITDPVERKVFNNIPVEIINTELITNEGKVYEVLDGTDTVNVTAIGKSSVFDYVSRDDLKAVADLSELTFMNTVGIRVSSARNNSELEFRTNIDNVKLAIEKMDRDQKVINVSTSGEPASGYVVGGITPSQNVVRYSGPESLINQIDHIDAVININGYSSDINTTADLKIYDADNNEIKNSSIKLNITTVPSWAIAGLSVEGWSGWDGRCGSVHTGDKDRSVKLCGARRAGIGLCGERRDAQRAGDCGDRRQVRRFRRCFQNCRVRPGAQRGGSDGEQDGDCQYQEISADRRTVCRQQF